MINKLVNYIKDSGLKINYVNNLVNVINYDDILEVKDDVVTFIKNNKIIMIKGDNLKLSKLLDEEVLITGVVRKIEL